MRFKTYSYRHKFKQIVSALVLCFALSYNSSYAAENCIAVYYPDVNKPYNIVFKQLLSGIEEAVDIPLYRFPVSQREINPDDELLKNNKNCAVILGLGRSGLKVALASKSSTELSAVVGAVVIQPDDIDGVTGISLVPQSEEIFKRLSHFSPWVKSVYVVYNAVNNKQIVTNADKAAAKFNIKLIKIEADNLKSSFSQYNKIMRTIDAKTSAIWMLHDPATIDTRTILPFVLEKAWNKKTVIFSNVAGHARNGALFSVVPDNVKLGYRLGKLAQDCIKMGCINKKISYLRDLLTAVNKRTAKRLGIRLNTRRDPYVDFVFPRR